MANSGILKQAVKILKTKKTATHFALCNGDKIRYLISIKYGKTRLSENISTYSRKLELLMRWIVYLPFSFLQLCNIGYFVVAKLDDCIETQRKKTDTEYWNMIVGTYDEKQKIVLQCFNKSGHVIFMKVGNQATAIEMYTEIEFLNSDRQYSSFALPQLVTSTFLDENIAFNIQVTKEFCGDKVEPILTEDIIKIYREISLEKNDGLEFSHGDFAPWNLKRINGNYILFDWEYCGYRICGFDLIHYAIIVEMVINNKCLSDAYDIGLENIRKYMPDFMIDKEAFLAEFEKLRKQIG